MKLSLYHIEDGDVSFSRRLFNINNLKNSYKCAVASTILTKTKLLGCFFSQVKLFLILHGNLKNLRFSNLRHVKDSY